MSKSPYSIPEIYEIAFSFRDYEKAVDFITEAALAAGLASIESVLELGCGPGQYCLEFGRREKNALGLDLAPEMAAYVTEKAKSEGISCRGIEADFCDFTLEQPVDLACCMMATFEHLLSNRDVLAHFDAVARNLSDDGIYLIEMSHPKDILTSEKSAETKWTMERDGTEVETDWACTGETDPLTEVDDITVTYNVKTGDKTESFVSKTQTRSYTAGLMRALIDLSGRFKISSMYGDLDMNRPFDNDKKSWRMIFVLRKH